MSSSTSTNNNNQNIKPKSCVYGCGIQIYWNSSVNEYWEVFTKKKHICPNRGNRSSATTTTTTTTTTKDGGITPPSTAQKPRYFNPSARKRTPYASLANQQPKPKMSNSFEYLQGSIIEIQKKYEICLILLRSMEVRFMVLKEIEILKLVSLTCIL